MMKSRYLCAGVLRADIAYAAVGWTEVGPDLTVFCGNDCKLG